MSSAPSDHSAAAASSAPQQQQNSLFAPAESGAQQDEDQSRPTRSASAATRLARSLSAAARLSRWRLPEGDGELPLYVQRMFRVKAFGLLSVQLVCVLIETALVDRFRRQYLDDAPDSDFGLGDFTICMTGVLAIILLMALHGMKDTYPVNYVLILMITIVVGVFLGLFPILFQSYLAFQILGILAVSMMVSTGLVAILTRGSMDPRITICMSVGLGWFGASCLDIWIMHHLGMDSSRPVPAAALLALSLLTAMLLLDSGDVLIKCNPDDFALVVVSMDSALLLVSLPVFAVKKMIARQVADVPHIPEPEALP